MQKYRVTKQYLQGGEIHAKDFNELPAAKQYIIERMVEDKTLNVKVIYRVYEFFDEVPIFDSSKEEVALPSSENSSGSSQGASSKSTFTPTPFNTSPRPPGMPHNWQKDDDSEKK